MNRAEWLTYAVALLSLAGYLLGRFRSGRVALVLSLLGALPLYWSLEGTSQFITADENYYIHELCKPDRTGFLDRELRAGAFRTSLSILAPVISRLERTDHWPATRAVRSLKLSHWITGWLTFLWILHLLLAVVPSAEPKLLFPLAFASLLLLPVTQMALKTFNYDVLSLNLGIVAFLYLVLALERKSRGAAALAVIVATLAAQEKLLASPVLLASIAVWAYLRTEEAPAIRAWRLAANALGGMALAWGLGFVSVVILRWSMGLAVGNMGAMACEAAQPLVIWGWGVLLFTLGSVDFGGAFPALLALTLLLILAGAALLLAVQRSRRLESCLEQGRRFLPHTVALLLALIVIVGVIANYSVTAYWAPFQPIQAGNYEPPGKLNGTVLHFQARSHAAHLLSSIGYACAVFLDDVPSVFWLMAGLVFLSAVGRAHLAQKPTLALLTLGCLLGPVALGGLQVMIGHRYLNIFLFWIALFLLALAAVVLSSLRPGPRRLAACVLVAGCVLEVLPFRPFYAAFRPIWLRYPDDTAPVVGRINPSWMGWGEEMMLAGQTLRAAEPARPLTLYCCYWSGAWVQRDPNVRQVLVQGITRREDVRYTDADYFVLNRSMVVQGFAPPELSPDLTIGFRGFEQAWVYQGARLAAAGYFYDPVKRCFQRE